MNKEVARKRYMDVIRPDVMHNSQGDFLATHVPMKKLYITEHLTDHAEVPEQDKKYPKTDSRCIIGSRRDRLFSFTSGK